MPNNKYLLILGFMLIVSTSHSQQVFEKNLDSYVSYINKNVLKFIRTNKQYASYNKCLKQGRYLIVPQCGFDGINILTSTSYVDLLRVDTSFINYRIEYVNDSLYIVPNLYGDNQYLDTNVVQLRDFPRSVFYTLYQQAKKYSPYCFALKLRDGADPAANFLVAYIEGNKLKVIGTNNVLWPVKYNSLQEYIVVKYGSVKNYADMCKSDMLLRKANSLTVAECKQRLKHSYVYYAKYFPADTAKIMQLFISEIDSSLQLNNTQKTSLATGMQAALANSTKRSLNASINFLHTDAYPVLLNTVGLVRANAFKEIYATNRAFEQQIYDTLIDAYSNGTDKVLADYFRE